MLLLRRALLVAVTRFLRQVSRDFPARWRLERFAVGAIRTIGPSLQPVIVATRDGFPIWADPAEWIGQYIYATGRYEESTVGLMTRLLAPGDCFVDVGANVGYLTLVAARLVGPTGSVVAFEPLPTARAWLERNASLNRLSHVSIRSEAACDRTSTAVLTIGPLHHTSTSSLIANPAGSGEALVPCVRLDDVFAETPRVRLIKIDVEGAEHLVVEGASRLLDVHSPDIIVELNGPEVGEALRLRGYIGFRLDGSELGAVNGQVNALFTKRPGNVFRGQAAAGRAEAP
jgi:FkbM family methyltransferase